MPSSPPQPQQSTVSKWSSYLHAFKKLEIDVIFRSVPPKTFRHALELGGGDGFESSLLEPFCSSLIATDFDPSILKIPSTTVTTFETCDAEEVEKTFRPQQFDCIFSSNVLEHLPHPDLALKGMHTILKDDGIAIHVLPNNFWKFSYLVLYYPAVAFITIRFLFRKFLRVEREAQSPNIENNPKSPRRKHSLLFRVLFPGPHGVSKNHREEWQAFKKVRWIRLFHEFGFDVITIRRGPVASGHGFRFDRLRKLFHALGFSSEHIFIMKKSGEASPYEQYFLDSPR